MGERKRSSSVAKMPSSSESAKAPKPLEFTSMAELNRKVTIPPKAKAEQLVKSMSKLVALSATAETEGDHENAYVLYMKYLSLFIEKVSSNWLREFKLEVHVKMFMRVY